jgi:hypothetical protein
VVKAVLHREISIIAYIRKEEISKIINISFHFRKLGKRGAN